MRVIGRALRDGATEYNIGHGRSFRIVPSGEWVCLFSYVGDCTLPVWSMRRKAADRGRAKCLAFVQQTIDALA